MKEKKVYYFCISPHLFLLRVRWNFLISRSWLRNLFAFPNTKLFYFRARVHQISVDCWFFILFSPTLENLNEYKLHKSLSVNPVSCADSVQASWNFCPAFDSSLHFHLHNSSLKILDDSLTPNTSLFPPTQTKRLNTIIIIPKRKTRKKATRRTTADGFAEGEEVNITCITGILWAKRGEHGITREAQDGGERACYAE